MGVEIEKKTKKITRNETTFSLIFPSEIVFGRKEAI